MIVLHGGYLQLHGFYLWGEGTLSSDHARDAHPRAVSGEELQATLRAELTHHAGGGGIARGRRRRITLTVPAWHGRPIPSSPALREHQDSSAPSTAMTLRAFELDAVFLSPSETLDVLLALPESLHTERTGALMAADDLDYWAEVARFTFDLLLRRRIAPTVDEGIARWRPALEGAHERERFGRFASALPPVSRAAALAEGPARPKDVLFPSADALLRSFLDDIVDAAARDYARSVVPAERRRPTEGEESRLVASLAAPLGDRDDAVAQAKGVDPGLSGRMHAWSLPLLEPHPEGELRLGVRLVPPDTPPPLAPVDGEGAGAARASTLALACTSARGTPPAEGLEAPGWTLQYHLEARDDPSLQIPATDVWSTSEGSLRRLGRRFTSPQETLLTRLGAVSLLSAPIARSLQDRHPTAASLTLEEAYRFLADEAPLLTEVGVSVLLPAEGKRTSVSVRLHVAESGWKTGTAVTRFGLATLVDFDWRVAVGDSTLSPAEFEDLANQKVPLVSIRGEWVLLDRESVARTLKLFDRRPSGRTTLGDLLRLAGGLETEMGSYPIEAVVGEGWLRDFLDPAAARAEIQDFEVPRGLVGTLRPYQVRGVGWLRFLLSRGLGACLADDMGLGKTVQFLATLLSAREAGEPIRPSLLVCPTSVAENWVKEAARFAPELTLAIHHGPERATGEGFHQVIDRTDLLVTTYALAHRDRALLSSVAWEYLALDEAQNVKNPAAAQSRAVRALRARRRAALTGTPMENRLSELKSIFDVLNPGLLGTDDSFRTEFSIPIERRRDEGAAQRLRRITAPFLLRRAKTDEGVAHDLPEKIETKELVWLTKEQASLYRATMKTLLSGIEKASGRSRREKVLLLLLRLKQICNHPALFLGDGNRLSSRSGKLSRLLALLEETLAEKTPSLLFTQFAEMGHILVHALKDRFATEVLFLHGGVPRRGRDEMVRRFQEDDDPPLFFVLSLKAGGSGLNLTRASHVFHVDRWWNPAVEDQATDRAFRIGQKQNVQVHKFVCKGTLEERIDQMIEDKKALARTIIGAGETWISEMTDDELARLVALSPDAVDMAEPRTGGGRGSR